jgi:hypothetical protein
MTCRDDPLAVIRTGRDLIGVDDVHLDHGRSSIHTPDALVRESLHRRLAECEKTGDSLLGCRRTHAR